MSEERLNTNIGEQGQADVQAEKAAKKKKKKKTNKIVKWFRDMRAELKKVTWPSKKQVVNNTLVVLVVVVIVAIVLWGFDALASAIVDVIFSIF